MDERSLTRTIVYSAYKLEPAEIKNLLEKFSFISADNLENIVDKSLIAGLLIYHGSQIIDLSVKGKLNSLKKKIYEID